MSEIQSQLISTEKTMLDWFAENGFDHISVDVEANDQADIIAVYAKIELDKATGRGKHSYFAVNEDGQTCVGDEYGEEISASDAVVFSTYVQKIEATLAKPYPAGPSKKAIDPETDQWIIWSIEHNSWWAKHRCGYVQKIKNAGIYSYADAVEIVEGANRHNGDRPYETMVLVTDEVRDRMR